MTTPVNIIIRGVIERTDIGHLALLAWALGASGLAALMRREAAEATRRTEIFMQEFLQEFLQELSRFNRNIEGDEK
ncbi:MAG: hypothetical protein ACRC7G_00655 [Beijerinckiaceae bacterium]